MSKLKVFCFGFGQVAESFVNKLIYEKKAFDLSISSRQETHQIEFNNLKINSYQFTKGKIDVSILEKLEETNYKISKTVTGSHIFQQQVFMEITKVIG